MGAACSKNATPVVNSAEVNLFVEDDVDQPEIKFSLDDEYAFDELLDKVLKCGCDCVVEDPTGIVCGRISSTYECTSFFGHKCIVVQYMTIRSNGTVFFRSERSVVVDEYPDKMKLSQLAVRPVMLGEKEKLCDRGRKFAKYGLGAHYMVYSDKMFVRGFIGVTQISGEGRVMVDTSSFLHFNPDYRDKGMARARRYGHEEDGMRRGSGHDDKAFSRTIPESSYHLCWPTLCGFSLKTKRWGEIAVNHLSEIEFSEGAFDMLVLEKDSKEMVRGFVQNLHKDQFTDIIQGKGGGCSFLLQGPPGVGKTLTAEAVSESLHRPLYCVDVGELGITPEALEDRLKKILEVAERWNAVVLIDECDIFLAARNKDDVLRNAMVGIFLRLLEYYNGILFLTSNRADDLDQAFQSRISVTVEYKALDVQSRKKVWNNLLGAAGVDTQNSNELLDVDEVSKYELNGRQIKTAIRLAASLADTSKEPLGQRHLIQTISFANAEQHTTGR